MCSRASLPRHIRQPRLIFCLSATIVWVPTGSMSRSPTTGFGEALAVTVLVLGPSLRPPVSKFIQSTGGSLTRPALALGALHATTRRRVLPTPRYLCSELECAIRAPGPTGRCIQRRLKTAARLPGIRPPTSSVARAGGGVVRNDGSAPELLEGLEPSTNGVEAAALTI